MNQLVKNKTAASIIPASGLISSELADALFKLLIRGSATVITHSQKIQSFVKGSFRFRIKKFFFKDAMNQQ